MTEIVSMLASNAPELTDIVGKFINWLYEGIGSFGWTVVAFTVILKLILSPLDVWQKISQRKQSRSMARLQPQLMKLQKQYENKPEILKQKQSELYRTEKMGMFGMCLPMIATMIVFIVMLNGFNAMVRYQNEMIVYQIADAYNAAIANGTPLTQEQLAALYQPESWLWIKNIFMPDTWANVIPNADQYLNSGMGMLGATMPGNVNIQGDWYNVLVGPATELHNKGNFWDIKNWNGYMVLPILSVITSILSAKFMQSSQPVSMEMNEEKKKNQQRTQKMMMYIMPLIFCVFAFMYSAAFALYIFVSNLISTAFGVVFTLVTKAKDKKEKELVENTTYRR